MSDTKYKEWLELMKDTPKQDILKYHYKLLIKCEKQKKVLDKIKEYILQNCEIIRLVEENVDKVGRVDGSKILELLEEIE